MHPEKQLNPPYLPELESNWRTKDVFLPLFTVRQVATGFTKALPTLE